MAAPRKKGIKPSGIIRRSEAATRVTMALLGALFATLAGFAAFSRIGEPLVTLSYDLPFITHHAGWADEIRIVYLSKLDKQSVDRTRQAELLDRLGEAGAKMVIYDLIFDRESEDPQVDQEFAAAMRRFRGVEDSEGFGDADRRQVFLACGRRTFRMTGVLGEQLIPPNNTLLDAADNFGLVATDDSTFMVRKLTTGTVDEPGLVWVAAQAAGAELDESTRMDARWMNYAGPPSTMDQDATTDQDTFAHEIRSCPAASVLDGEFNPAFFKDKIVLVGGEPGIVGEALGDDLFETPFHRFHLGGKLPFMSGVEIQANSLANLIQGNWLIRSSPRFDFWLVMIAGIAIGILFSSMRPAAGIPTAFLVAVGFAAAGLLSVHYGRVWFPWSVAAFAQLPVALVWGVASNLYVERFFRLKLSKEQQAIREAFAKYLSPQMLDRLTLEGFNTDLGGEKIETAIMFTDLENFTDMCERIGDPQRVVETMNHYFEKTTDSIFTHDGVVIKFIGDAIFAVWGAPIPDPEPMVKAARAAWDLFENDKLVIEGEELRTRIGIHFGEVVAGNIGSTRRVDYTLIGDAVNLASRIEGVNKMLGTHILMSGAAASFLDESFRTRRVGSFRVKGRSESVELYELLGPVRHDSPPEWVMVYHEALARLEAGDNAGAMKGFATVDSMRDPRGDGPSRFLTERIRSGDVAGNGTVELKDK